MLYPVDTLPANIAAERAVLGCVILNNSVAAQMLGLPPAAFSVEANRYIAVAIRTLCAAGRGITPLTLQDELTKMEQLTAVGGPACLAALFDGMPRFSDISEYVRLVREAFARRKAMAIGNWLFNEAQADDARIEDLLAALTDKIEDLREGQQDDDLVSSEVATIRAMSELETRWTGGDEIIGLPTGFSDVDRILRGLRGGKYYTIAAGTGIGKTTLALNFADRIIADSSPDDPRVGLILSLEISVEELVVKQISIATRLDSDRIETGALSAAEKQAVRTAAERLKRIPVEYVEGFAKVTAGSIAARVAKVRRKHKLLSFLIVDYLQLLDSDDRRENEHLRLTEISRTLKRIARQYDIPVIVLSQLNRDHARRSGQNRDYQLSDLRGSGSIEEDSDVVMFLMPQDWNDEENPGRRLFIAKHRGGRKHVTVPLVFFGEQSRFESAAIKVGGDGLGGLNEWPRQSQPQAANGKSNGHKHHSKQEQVRKSLDEYYEVM